VVKPRIVIAGSLAQKPRQGGHTWQFLNYLLGFKQLGWDVLFVDRIEPEMCTDAAGSAAKFEDSVNLEYFLHIMRVFGLEDQFSLIHNKGEQVIGVPRSEVIDFTRTAAALINVMGFLHDAEILGAAQRRVFLDTDPGFGQMWCDLGLANLFTGHDNHVTIAENIGKPECAIPTCGLQWITWRQPIVLSEWPAQSGGGGAFTSIGSWRGPYAPVEHRGTTYGLRAHEFRKFAALPKLTQGNFEIALDIASVETRDIQLLKSNGWALAEPAVIAANPWAYRDYIRRSAAEFMATKGMYVHTRSGWFSERSICYLASGRPVLAQDTGLAKLLPHGEGLLLFSTIGEASDGLAQILGNHAAHSRAARAIAEECFRSDKVLRDLLRKLRLG